MENNYYNPNQQYTAAANAYYGAPQPIDNGFKKIGIRVILAVLLYNIANGLLNVGFSLLMGFVDYEITQILNPVLSIVTSVLNLAFPLVFALMTSKSAKTRAVFLGSIFTAQTVIRAVNGVLINLAFNLLYSSQQMLYTIITTILSFIIIVVEIFAAYGIAKYLYKCGFCKESPAYTGSDNLLSAGGIEIKPALCAGLTIILPVVFRTLFLAVLKVNELGWRNIVYSALNSLVILVCVLLVFVFGNATYKNQPKAIMFAVAVTAFKEIGASVGSIVRYALTALKGIVESFTGSGFPTSFYTVISVLDTVIGCVAAVAIAFVFVKAIQKEETAEIPVQ